MISTRAIEIIPLLKEPFDYEEYVAKCTDMGFDILPETSYPQKVGILKASIVKYPNLEPELAYMTYFNGNNKTQNIKSSDGKSSCCGGGKTL